MRRVRPVRDQPGASRSSPHSEGEDGAAEGGASTTGPADTGHAPWIKEEFSINLGPYPSLSKNPQVPSSLRHIDNRLGRGGTSTERLSACAPPQTALPAQPQRVRVTHPDQCYVRWGHWS